MTQEAVRRIWLYDSACIASAQKAFSVETLEWRLNDREMCNSMHGAHHCHDYWPKSPSEIRKKTGRLWLMTFFFYFLASNNK